MLRGCKLTLNCTRGGGRGGVKLTLPPLDPVPNCKSRFVPQSNTETSVTLIQKRLDINADESRDKRTRLLFTCGDEGGLV